MASLWFFLHLAVLLLMTVLTAPKAQAADIDLSPAEMAWLKDNPEVHVGLVIDNAPYSFFGQGRPMGWSVDLLRRLEDVSGLRMRFRMGTWTEIYKEFRAGGLDAIEAISYTPERAAFILFTEPYHLRRMMLFHNVERPLPPAPDLAGLAGRRIGIIKDIYYGAALRELGLDLVEYAGYRDLLAALAFGWIDAAVAPELTGGFFARENGFTSVAVAGPLPAATVALEDFRIGVGSHQAILRSILDKALAAVPDADLAAITERWQSYRGGLRMSGGTFRLLPEERDWLAIAGPVRVGFMPDYEPFSFLADGRGMGFALDLLMDVGDRTGLVVEPVFDSWPNLLDRLKAGDIQMIGNISFTEERSAWSLFSQEYYRIPSAVFVRSGFGPYAGLASLDGRRVAIGRDIFYQRQMVARFGDGVVTYTNQADMLLALAQGEVDAVIMALPNGTSMVRKLGLINVEIAGEFTMDGVEREDLRFGVTPALPFLHSIVDRAIGATPPSRWREMEARWLGPRFVDAAPAAGLTAADRRALAEKGIVRVCAGPGMPPYEEMDSEGGYRGVAADVARLLAERGGFDWHLVPSIGRRGAAVDWVARSACDLMPFAASVPVDDGAWTLSEPYLKLPLVVATRLEAPFLDGPDGLAGQTIGVPRTHALLDRLRKRYPDITFVEVVDELDGLQRVAQDALDGTIGTLASLSHHIVRQRYNTLKISGRLPDQWHIGVAIRTTDPALAPVLEKLVATLGEAEVQDALNRWMAARVERTVDYTLLGQVALAALLILSLFLYWNRKLHHLNSALAEANGKLHVLSRTDALTGLPNRGDFEDRLAEAFALARRNRLPFAVAMIDVDFFKKVNDEMGHPFGDACLRQVAKILDSQFKRDGDVVARYGGEEFVTFTVGAGAVDFSTHLEMLRARVADHMVQFGGLSRRLTISIGCYAGVPDHVDEVESFVKNADVQLYKAKNSGRNKVMTQHGGGVASDLRARQDEFAGDMQSV